MNSPFVINNSENTKLCSYKSDDLILITSIEALVLSAKESEEKIFVTGSVSKRGIVILKSIRDNYGTKLEF